MTSGNRKNNFSLKIETADDALQSIRYAYIMCFMLAVLQAGIGFFLAEKGAGMIIDAVLYLACGLILMKWKSLVPAVIVAVVSAVGLVSTFMNIINQTSGGRNTTLALLMFIVSLRAVYAAYKMKKINKDESEKSESVS